MKISSANALLIGHSHLDSIRLAAESSGSDWLHILSLRSQEFTPFFTHQGLHPDLVSTVKSKHPTVCFFHIHGNQHNTMGLVNHPQKYDFFLKGESGLSTNISGRIVPYAQVENAMRQSLELSIASPLSRFLALVNCPSYFIESHPPVSSDQFIMSGGLYDDLMAQHGVSPVDHRYKLWRLHNRILKSICRRLGVAYLPSPQEATDDKGCLLEHLWGPQGVHGNELYGQLVLEELKAVFQKTISSNV